MRHKRNYLHETASLFVMNTVGGNQFHQWAQTNYTQKQDIYLREIELHPSLPYSNGNNSIDSTVHLIMRAWVSPIPILGHNAIVSSPASYFMASDSVPQKYTFDDIFVKKGTFWFIKYELYGSQLNTVQYYSYLNLSFKFRF